MNLIARILVVSMYVIGLVTAVDEEVNNKIIKELEKQKSELYKQINNAIDESMKSLLTANDAEATLGLEYMRDLKEHIKELNGTDKESNETKAIDVDSKSDLENRRSYKGLEYYKNKRIPKNDPFDFESVLKPKKISESDWKEMITNRNKMQQKLDLWLTERQKEKDRLKQLKMDKKRLKMAGKYEKCPRFGYGKKKTKDRTRSRRCASTFNATTGKRYEACDGLRLELAAAAGRGKRRQDRKLSAQKKYPCCRKCCKKSYMGCL